MIGKNITKLRKRSKVSQEELAEAVGITRQTVAKWESEESIPDVISCNKMAEFFNVSIDDMMNYDEEANKLDIPPKGKYMFGTVRVGDKGQIVIPVKARKTFDIKPGDELIMLGDIENGLALVKTDFFWAMYSNMQGYNK